jgi:hypothetical protein
MEQAQSFYTVFETEPTFRKSFRTVILYPFELNVGSMRLMRKDFITVNDRNFENSSSFESARLGNDDVEDNIKDDDEVGRG